MKVGDLIRVSWKENDIYGPGIIVADPPAWSTNTRCIGFFTILFDGELRTMHSDFMEAVNEAR